MTLHNPGTLPAPTTPERVPTIVRPAGDTAGLFRGRPYGPANIFVVTFSGAAGETQPLWSPDNAYFELAMLIIKGSAAADYTLCDTKPDNIIGFIDANGTGYTRLDMGLSGLRSQSSINAKLLLLDPVGVAATVKGVAYGWRVSREGYYAG